VSIRTGPLAIAVMHHFEGCRLRAYLCPANVWTIGWGNTRYEDGRAVRQGDVITQARADELFLHMVRTEFDPGVRQAIGSAVTTPAQFGAMVSLAYNIGTGAFARSRVCSNHRAGKHKAAAASFMGWTRGGGRVLPGLVRRRNVERLLYEGHFEAVRKIVQ
jgi:GH24 family phage-related lysozyme (muramidase)